MRGIQTGHQRSLPGKSGSGAAAGRCGYTWRKGGRSCDTGRAHGQIWKEIHAATEAVAKDVERRQMSAEEAKFYQEDWRAPGSLCFWPPACQATAFAGVRSRAADARSTVCGRACLQCIS